MSNIAFAVRLVFCVSVTVVDWLVAFAGESPVFLVHPLHVYHVFTTALILGVSPYLYTHLHVTSGHHVNCALQTDGFHVPFTKSYIQYTPLLFLHGT